MDNPAIFIVLIIAVIVLAMLLPRWIRRSTGSAGRRAGTRAAESRLVDALGGLETTVVIEAPETLVREIIDEIVLQQPRKFTIFTRGDYGIRFVEPDDAVVRLVVQHDGTHVRIERAREYLGSPTASEFWGELRSRITSAARGRGLTVVERPAGVRLERRAGDPPTWTVADGSAGD